MQEFDFDLVDLMAAQNCRHFDNLHNALLLKYWDQYSLKYVQVAYDLERLMKTYNPLICIDECHSILQRCDWSSLKRDDGHLLVTFTSIWDSLSSIVTSKLVLFLLSTTLSNFISLRLDSTTAKFYDRPDRFILFHNFTFHEKPRFLNAYIDFPLHLMVWLKGRARLGTHMLQCIIANASLFNNSEAQYNALFESIFVGFYNFHVHGRASNWNMYLTGTYRSLKANITKYTSVVERSGDVVSKLVLLLFATLSPTNLRIADKDVADYINNGIGFLEPSSVDPEKYLISLREPLLRDAILNNVPFDKLSEHFIDNLTMIRQYYGATETSKGIAFQYAVMTALMSREIESRTIGQLLCSWTGENQEKLLERANWLEPIWDQNIDISSICQLRQNSLVDGTFCLNTLYVLPDDARCEFVVFVKGKDGNVVAITSGVKLLSDYRKSTFAENVTAARFDGSFVSHKGLVYANVAYHRSIIEEILNVVVGNIALVVTMPKGANKDRVEVVNDLEQQFPTMLVYIDKNNLSTLLGEAHAAKVMDFYS